MIGQTCGKDHISRLSDLPDIFNVVIIYDSLFIDLQLMTDSLGLPLHRRQVRRPSWSLLIRLRMRRRRLRLRSGGYRGPNTTINPHRTKYLRKRPCCSTGLRHAEVSNFANHAASTLLSGANWRARHSESKGRTAL
jgi:hypothetical protein